MEEDIDSILERAVLTWGETAQFDQCIEECAELIQAINKRKRGIGELVDLVTEMVDVYLMIRQLKYIVNNDKLWDEQMEFKVNRLVARLDKYS